MNKKIFASTVCVAMLALSAVTRADVAYNVSAWNLYNNTGAPIADGMYRIIIDTNGDGIGSASATSWELGADDFLLGTSPIVDGDGSTPDSLQLPTSVRSPNHIDPSDNIYGVWFATPFSSATPGYSTAYGVERLGIVDVDGQGLDYSFSAVGGKTTFSTPAAAVPEPASICMGLASVGFLTLRRRAKIAK